MPTHRLTEAGLAFLDLEEEDCSAPLCNQRGIRIQDALGQGQELKEAKARAENKSRAKSKRTEQESRAGRGREERTGRLLCLTCENCELCHRNHDFLRCDALGFGDDSSSSVCISDSAYESIRSRKATRLASPLWKLGSPAQSAALLLFLPPARKSLVE
jgi:hypothetical protein